MSKRSGSSGSGSIASGAVTALAFTVQTGLAAVVGVVIGRKFGRTDETDGFFVAYGVFVVLVLAASALRVVALPRLTRARAQGRLGGELAGDLLALAVFSAPVLVIVFAAAHPVATLLAGDSKVAQDVAASSLQWMIPAAIAQLFAGVLASALASFDDYATAAAGYALGSVAGLALILASLDHGIIAVSWGMALNGTIALAVPALGLLVRARREGVPARAARPVGQGALHRLLGFAQGIALPLVLQALYALCLPFASRVGTGAATTFGYGYLLAAGLVTVTASSLGLVSAVPLTREGAGSDRVARHIVATAWLSLALIAAAAGVFAIAGGPLLGAVLGAGYKGDVGGELGRLVVAFSPWIVASVGVTVTFPLVFVADRARRLPAIALALIVVHVPLAWLGREIAGLEGLALALAVTTSLAFVATVRELGVTARVVRGLAAAGVVVGVLAAASFGVPAALFGAAASAAIGVALYGLLVSVLRPRPLMAAWRYLRTLG